MLISYMCQPCEEELFKMNIQPNEYQWFNSIFRLIFEIKKAQ